MTPSAELDLFPAPTASAAPVDVHAVWKMDEFITWTACGLKNDFGGPDVFEAASFNPEIVTCSECVKTLRAVGLSGLTASDGAVAHPTSEN